MNASRMLVVVAPVTLLGAALGSLGLMLCVGQFNSSRLLLVIFAAWVLLPFLALALINRMARKWSVATRATVYVVTVIVSLGSLAIYGNVVSLPADTRPAAPFLLVPLASWLLMMIVIPIAAVRSGRLAGLRWVRWVLRSLATVATLVVAGMTVLVGLLYIDHRRETVLPTPTGLFAVGRTTLVWRDPLHADSTAPRADAARELVAWIWYPAAPPQRSRGTEEYLPWLKVLEHRQGALGGGAFTLMTRDLSRVRTHSICDAELSPKEHSYPVILMRAGLSALTISYTSLAEDLASHGYVVVGFDAPYRSNVVVFADGRVITRSAQNNPERLTGPRQEQLAIKLVQAWTADMSFALDQLGGLNTSDPTGKFVGRLDMQRVGVFGHSLGGATALQLCHDDPRCKAGIDVDGAPIGSVVAEGVTQPFMFLMADHGSESKRRSSQGMQNIRSIYDRLPSDGRWEIVIRGGNHYMFSDDGAMLKNPLFKRAMGITGIDGRRQVAVTAHYISTFFDVYLKGAPASGLETKARFPEVEYLR